MPIISVVMPVYNTERYLAETLDSILTQTLKEIEIICVNDGSTDNSKEILDTYVAKDKRIRAIHNVNTGAGESRNIGLAEAKGKYIIFFDSDDILYSTALEKMHAKIEEEESDIVICGADKLYANGRRTPVAAISKSANNKAPFKAEQLNRVIFQSFSPAPWNKLFRISFIQDHNLKFQNLVNSNDTFFTKMAIVLANKISVLDETLVDYRVHGTSTTASSRDKHPECIYISNKAIKSELEKLKLYDRYKQSYSNMLVDQAFWQYSLLKNTRAKIITVKCCMELLRLSEAPYNKKGYIRNKLKFKKFKRKYRPWRRLFHKLRYPNLKI